MYFLSAHSVPLTLVNISMKLPFPPEVQALKNIKYLFLWGKAPSVSLFFPHSNFLTTY